jgi:phage-related holin
MDNKTKEILQKFSTQKVDLGIVQDFEKVFNKANDSGLKVSQTLIDALGKAEQKFNQNLSEWDRAIKIGEKLEQSYKDLGVEVPSIIKNKIASCKSEKKEEQGFISAIKSFYSKF